MKTITIIMMLVMLGLGSILTAETSRALGLHFGTVSGNGFSYRQFNGKNGFQATLGAITWGNNDYYFDNIAYTNNTDDPQIVVTEDGRTTHVNVGLNYLRALADNPTGRFYVFGGAAYINSTVKVFEQDYELVSSSENGDHYQIMGNHPLRTSFDNRSNYYVGAGMGFELNLGRGFKWAIEMPITLNKDGVITMYIPQTGLYYYFGKN